MSKTPDWLPPLVLFSDFGGDWDSLFGGPVCLV